MKKGEIIEREIINAEPTVTMLKSDYEVLINSSDCYLSRHKYLLEENESLKKQIQTLKANQSNDEITIVISNDGIKINHKAL